MEIREKKGLKKINRKQYTSQVWVVKRKEKVEVAREAAGKHLQKFMGQKKEETKKRKKVKRAARVGGKGDAPVTTRTWNSKRSRGKTGSKKRK